MRADSSTRRLRGVRRLIDAVDDGLLALLGARHHLVNRAAQIKAESGRPVRDPRREREVKVRARRLARALGLPQASSDRFVAWLIAEACRQQPAVGSLLGIDPGPDLDQGETAPLSGTLPAPMTAHESPDVPHRWLRWLPPPRRLAPGLRRVPSRWAAQVLESILQRALASALARGALAELQGRRLGIEVDDLGLCWNLSVSEGRLRVLPDAEPAEATVRGSATDLLLLASRREDADTLFFQRRLVLTGDIELGLTARNLLDQLPWQDVPLGLRIALHRGAGLAQAARRAYRGD